jgi:hypothetical protein
LRLILDETDDWPLDENLTGEDVPS